VYVNLKGREKGGTVDSKDYHNTRDKIIELFQNLQDPNTGDNVVNMVLRKEEGEFLGLHGDRVGDIVYTLNTNYNDETAWILTKGLPVIDDLLMNLMKVSILSLGFITPIYLLQNIRWAR